MLNAVSNDPEIRFGLRRGDLRSGTYVVVGKTRTDDVYVMSREAGVQYKVSLHQSGSLRLSIEPIDPDTGEPGPPIGGSTWERPAPFAPGLTKMFAVLIPGSAVGMPYADEEKDQMRLETLPPGAKALQFTVIYADPDVHSSSWPGANAMHTTLVGQFTLPDSGERVTVVAHALDELPALPSEPMTAPLLPGSTRDGIRRAAEDGKLRSIVFGADDDGMRWFIDARVVTTRA